MIVSLEAHRANEQERRTRYSERNAAERLEFHRDSYERVEALVDWPLLVSKKGEVLSPPLWMDLWQNDHGRQVVTIDGNWELLLKRRDDNAILPYTVEGPAAESLRELVKWLPDRPTHHRGVERTAPAERKLYAFLETLFTSAAVKATSAPRIGAKL